MKPAIGNRPPSTGIFTGNGPMFLGEKSDSPGDESPEDKDVKELFRMMKKVKILKYAMLSFYYEYLERNKKLIEKNLEASP